MVVFGWVAAVAACSPTPNTPIAPQETNIEPISSTTASPSPSTSPTIAPTTTSTATSSPTPDVTPTFVPGPAPTLEPMNVTLITNGDRTLPWVALTFDLCQRPDDPTGFDQGIFDVLVEYQAPATFFMGGDWMRTHVEETRLLAAIPYFELGNHSWSHPDMRELNQEQLTQEILRTQNMMYQLIGRQGRLFRLPAGQKNDLVLGMIAYHGLYNIYWDVVTADPVYEFDAEVLLGLVKDRVQNGSIILMHANGRGWHTAEALPDIIEYLRGEGYCLVTVSQLLELEPPPEECLAP